MSIATFPADVVQITTQYNRTALWMPSTIIQTSENGKETRVALRSSPRYRWDLQISVLTDTAAAPTHSAIYQEVANFIAARSGPWDAFYYVDPKDTNTYLCRFTADFQFSTAVYGLWTVSDITFISVDA